VGPLGVPELIFLFILALLIFGPKKLPELGRTVGKALTEFRRASSELRNVVEDEVREFERQTADAKRQAEESLSAATADLNAVAAGSLGEAEPEDQAPGAGRRSTDRDPVAASPGDAALEKPAPVSTGPAPTDA
jgi:sec-independent protein translocase protein TatA